MTDTNTMDIKKPPGRPKGSKSKFTTRKPPGSGPYTLTVIRWPVELRDRAVARANSQYRSLPGYICYLIEQDLKSQTVHTNGPHGPTEP